MHPTRSQSMKCRLVNEQREGPETLMGSGNTNMCCFSYNSETKCRPQPRLRGVQVHGLAARVPVPMPAEM